MRPRICKDCAYGAAITFKKPPVRPAPYPGPRCATHHRAEQKRTKEAAHDAHVVRTYGLGPGDYDRLYALQNGFCAICQVATGKSKRLAVDHDHRTGRVRGLLCGPCNKLVGHARDDPEFFERAAQYLRTPPADKLEER